VSLQVTGMIRENERIAADLAGISAFSLPSSAVPV
jgi:hypothetical protein